MLNKCIEYTKLVASSPIFVTAQTCPTLPQHKDNWLYNKGKGILGWWYEPVMIVITYIGKEWNLGRGSSLGCGEGISQGFDLYVSMWCDS